MKNNNWIKLFIAFFVFFLGSIDVLACDTIIAQNLGKLYYVTLPINELRDPQSVANFVNINRLLFQHNSPTIRCARELGNRLIQQGLGMFNQADYDQAYETCINMGGNADQANQVKQSFQQGSIDAMMIGQELIWIANVIPRAANGDWTYYNQTGTQSRLSLRQVWPIYQQLGDPVLLSQVMSQFQPLIMYQVAFLALNL